MINLRDIRVNGAEEVNTGCQMKVYIGVNEACSVQYALTESHRQEKETKAAGDKAQEIHRLTVKELEGGQIAAREICTTDFVDQKSLSEAESEKGNGCRNCRGIDFDLKKLEKSILNKKHEHDVISTFCVIMKRFYPYDGETENGNGNGNGNVQCKGAAKVELIQGHQSGQGQISCPSIKKGEDGDAKNGNLKVKKRKSSLRGDKAQKGEQKNQKKEKHIDELHETNFAWRRVMTGINPYLVTIVAGFIALGSLFIIVT